MTLARVQLGDGVEKCLRKEGEQIGKTGRSVLEGQLVLLNLQSIWYFAADFFENWQVDVLKLDVVVIDNVLNLQGIFCACGEPDIPHVADLANFTEELRMGKQSSFSAE